jgi:hypothetical protein
MRYIDNYDFGSKFNSASNESKRKISKLNSTYRVFDVMRANLAQGQRQAKLAKASGWLWDNDALDVLFPRPLGKWHPAAEAGQHGHWLPERK